MRTRVYLCVLLAAALASSFGALRAAPANPLVGVWTILLPDVPGGDLTYLDVRRDGNYMLYSKVTGIGQEGTFTVTPPDHWRLVARTTSYADAGTYRLEGMRYLYLTGKLGTGRWTRVTRSPYFPEQMKSGQLVPKDIPALVQALVANARKRWRPDAIPVTLDVSDGNPVGAPMPTYGVPYFKVTVTVYSPSARSGWYVTVSPFSYRATRLPAGNPPPTQPLAAEFVDLPRAIAAARQHGMHAPLQEASLQDYEHWGSVWMIDSGLPGRGPTHRFQVLASGVYLPNGTGPIGDEKAEYEAEWDSAVDAFRALLRSGRGGGCPKYACTYIPNCYDTICPLEPGAF